MAAAEIALGVTDAMDVMGTANEEIARIDPASLEHRIRSAAHATNAIVQTNSESSGLKRLLILSLPADRRSRRSHKSRVRNSSQKQR